MEARDINAPRLLWVIDLSKSNEKSRIRDKRHHGEEYEDWKHKRTSIVVIGASDSAAAHLHEPASGDCREQVARRYRC